jgi:hypothetical protein
LTVEQVRTAASAWVEAQSRHSAARRGIYRHAAEKIAYYQRHNQQARVFHTRTTVARLVAMGIDVDQLPSCIPVSP